MLLVRLVLSQVLPVSLGKLSSSLSLPLSLQQLSSPSDSRMDTSAAREDRHLDGGWRCRDLFLRLDRILPNVDAGPVVLPQESLPLLDLTLLILLTLSPLSRQLEAAVDWPVVLVLVLSICRDGSCIEVDADVDVTDTGDQPGRPHASVAALQDDMERKDEVTSVMQQPAALLPLIDRVPLYEPTLVLGVSPIPLMLDTAGGRRRRSNDTCLTLPPVSMSVGSRERMSLTATAWLAPRSSSLPNII